MFEELLALAERFQGRECRFGEAFGLGAGPVDPEEGGEGGFVGVFADVLLQDLLGLSDVQEVVDDLEADADVAGVRFGGLQLFLPGGGLEARRKRGSVLVR